jgi:hypothetical protein
MTDVLEHILRSAAASVQTPPPRPDPAG